MEFPRKEAAQLETEEIKFQIVDWYIPEADKSFKRYVHVFKQADDEDDDVPKDEAGEDNEDEDTNGPDKFNMIVYGTTEEGNTVSLRIRGYQPYFYIKPPESWDNYSNKLFAAEMGKLHNTMSEEKYTCVFNKDGAYKEYKRKIVPYGYDTHLVSVEKVCKKDFWGFTNNKEFKFIKVTVKSLILYNNLRYYFQSAEMKRKGFKLYESNIDPFLRYIHEQNIKPCGWVSTSEFEEEENNKYFTRCDYNLVTDHKTVQPVDKNSIAPLLIASFDIECMSSHGDFPVAKKDYRKVAQDLANVAKAGYDITPELILYWLKHMYSADIDIDHSVTINRAYAKHNVGSAFEANYKQPITEVAPDIIRILDEISNVGSNADDGSDSDNETAANKPLTVKQQNALEAQLNEILTRILPELEGDKIIQVGTTVHRYGSDEIIYKNIITLDSCDPITDADVVSCDTEKQLLMQWKKLIKNLNPDILIGYNIFGFDMEYIWERAAENGICKKMFKDFGRNTGRQTTLLTKKLSSSALGENILNYLDIDGTVVIDLFKVMQRDHKLDSYKLDSVAQIFLGDQKDDLKPHEIFEKFKGSSKDRAIIAKYCIQDCALVNRLLHKLKILENNMGMGNVCLVPLSYLFMRGQGIKIFSLIAKECMDKGFVIPVIASRYDDNFIADEDGYEGAVVLEPKEGIYLNDPIVVFDYGSLYPSSMIARNLSHDCYVMDAKYQVPDPNIDYVTVSYDLYEGVGDKKRKVGVKDCTFARYTDGRKGVIADILCMLLHQRKNTRKKMEYQTVVTKDGQVYSGLLEDAKEGDDKIKIQNVDTSIKTTINKRDILSITDTYNKFEQDVFDALQLAYKITANSLYGQIGAKTSPIYLKDIAACTTATGREMIMLAKNFVETNYNAEVIYGDSVMPYTPLTYKTASDQIYVTTFEDAGCNNFWMPYEKFKAFDNDRTHKEQYMPNDIYVFTHKGWSKVRRIIRHKTTKKIYRIVTPSGIVDVTEDHSLLDANAIKIKPKDCVIGQKLLHSQPVFKETPEQSSSSHTQSYQAYVYGHYMANGKCYSCQETSAFIWEITNTNFKALKDCKRVLEVLECLKFKIIYRNGEYVLTLHYSASNEFSRPFVEKYKNLHMVPHCVINGSIDDMMKFKEGYDSALHHQDKYTFNINNQLKAQSLVVLLQMIGNTVQMTTDNNHIYITAHLASSTPITPSTLSNTQITDITILHEKYYGYVYDIETEEGVFNGGIGNMILKNTDSIFCKFPLKDAEGNPVQGKQALQYAIEVGKHVEKNIVPELPQPQKLNYEKSLYPFILFSKKRYVGNLYETDVNKFKQKSMGIALKRRDNAPIVKKIYGGIIDILLNYQDLHRSIEFLKDELTALVQGKTPIVDLVISKSLRGSYKDATKIPHKVLADRIAERDPGNKPQVNDRIPFVYIKVPDAKLQGDRIENPEYIIENNLTPDYLHYITNQIMNPILQLYALCLDELPNYDKTPTYWPELEETLKEKPLYKDNIKRKHRIDNLKLQMVKELLFDEFIYMLSEAPKRVSKSKQTKQYVPPEPVKRGTPTVVVSTPASATVAAPAKTKSKKTAQSLPVPPAATQTQASQEAITLNAAISVTKKVKTDITVSSASIFILVSAKKKTVLWTYDYEYEKLKYKNSEIIAIILDMVTYVREQQQAYKLSIKLKGNKLFVEEYHKSLAIYAEMEKSELQGDNAINKAIKEGDIGTLKSTQIIVSYMPLINVKEWFILEK